jgi:A/G-specific adenine glycosylase
MPQKRTRAPDKKRDRGAAKLLLDWYDASRRDLPWREAKPDPYRVWLSEIMLQQTTVKAVLPYYERFLVCWPSVQALAKAPLGDVLSAWAGLGYYARARNLHKCAQAVVVDHGGRFPATEAGLRELPGIGAYTAAAIAAIAFGERAAAVDGNVERVMARLYAVRTPLPAAKAELRARAEELVPAKRPGDLAQALMDLGATVCTPRRPSCLMCPLAGGCEARALGLEAQLPARAVKPERPSRHGVAFVALREDGCVLIRERPATGLLAGMSEVPSTAWQDDWLSADEALRAAPVSADWWPVAGVVTHTFTHFRLELMVYRALVPADATLTFWADPARCRWLPRRELDRAALPSVMKKVLAHALREG